MFWSVGGVPTGVSRLYLPNHGDDPPRPDYRSRREPKSARLDLCPGDASLIACVAQIGRIGLPSRRPEDTTVINDRVSVGSPELPVSGDKWDRRNPHDGVAAEN